MHVWQRYSKEFNVLGWGEMTHASGCRMHSAVFQIMTTLAQGQSAFCLAAT